MMLVDRTWRLALVAGLLLAAGAIAAPVHGQGPAAVSIVGISFQPSTITVAVGDTVTWTVTQAIGQQHSVTSGSPGSDQGKEFDSGIGLQNNGDTYKFTFQTAGTFNYFCQVHPTQMTGQIVVTAAGGSAPPASAAPATGAPASGAPATGAPAGSPAATQPPVSPEAGEPIPPENKLIAAGVLGVALVLLFAASWYWRRLNPA